MTREEANQLPTGVYILHWKSFDGTDTSVASVGHNEYGDSWYAPANWLIVPSYDWHRVKSVTLLRPSFPISDYIKQGTFNITVPIMRTTDDLRVGRLRAVQTEGQEDRGPSQPGQGCSEAGDAPTQEAVRD